MDENLAEPSSSLWDLERIFFAAVAIDCCLVVVIYLIHLPQRGAGGAFTGVLGWLLLCWPFVALAYPGVRCLVARRWGKGLIFVGVGLLLGLVVLFIATLIGYLVGGMVGI